jgi:hypothetical protein
LLGRLGPSYRSIGHFALRIAWMLIAGSRPSAPRSWSSKSRQVTDGRPT